MIFDVGGKEHNYNNTYNLKGGPMNSIKNKVKAVIFDMDGTIIKTEHIWDQVTDSTLDKYNIKLTPQERMEFLKTLTGMGMKDASSTIKKAFGLPDSVDEIIKMKLALANMHFKSRLEYLEGFEEFQRKLVEHHIPNGIATNAHPTNLETIKQTMDFTNKFGDYIYCIAHVNFKAKPDPALFLHTAKKLGAEPDACVVFEDSMHGFNAAKSAGMKCIAVKNDRNMHLLDHATNAISDYHEAEDVLSKI